MPAGDEAEETDEGEFAARSLGPPAKLERLQKILSQAGVASRRKAEEMIEQGRVQVNGTVVTALGTKADANRDHIRVDGKLLHGAERLRYFVLNKPKGFVTTVKDPEGRPTVMQFFDKMRERLYPVGRLDYMSEGLLLVTNDGDLANKLTKAGSGVEKVYLVKVAGQPTEAELDLLRAGVSIERGKPGSPQVRTSPARIRQVRQGDNPWYEVVLIEGRNRELRKMFVAVGHFVEKIRRVGYGPLVLDQEPGNMRELDAEELAALRLAAEGKLTHAEGEGGAAAQSGRRAVADGAAQAEPVSNPAQAVRGARKPFEPAKPFDSGDRQSSQSNLRFVARPRSVQGEFRPRPSFGKDKPFRPARPAGEGFRPAEGRGGSDRGKFGAKNSGVTVRRGRRGKKTTAPHGLRRGLAPGATGERRPPRGQALWRQASGGSHVWSKTGCACGQGVDFGSKPAGRPFAGKPDHLESRHGKSRAAARDRPPFKRPAAPRREAPAADR